jgi:DNA-binding NarL/FixJ family response regulator
MDPRQMPDRIRRDDPHKVVSARQIELLRLLGQGLNLPQAAKHMGITRKTANDHKCQLMYRLQLKTRKEVIRYARQVFPDLNTGN